MYNAQLTPWTCLSSQVKKKKCETILQFSFITENEAGTLTVEDEMVFHEAVKENGFNIRIMSLT